jgi:hypothetical protein
MFFLMLSWYDPTLKRRRRGDLGPGHGSRCFQFRVGGWASWRLEIFLISQCTWICPKWTPKKSKKQQFYYDEPILATPLDPWHFHDSMWVIFWRIFCSAVLRRYYLQKVKLGEGSFGTVWRAVDRPWPQEEIVSTAGGIWQPKKSTEQVQSAHKKSIEIQSLYISMG